MRPQFIKRWQCVVCRCPVGLRPRCRQRCAVQQLHASMEIRGGRGCRIGNPFAKQVRQLLMRAIGLALVDERRGMIDIFRALGIDGLHGGAIDGDFVDRLAIGALHAVERITGRKRDLDGGAGRFVDEVEAMIEELAEQYEKADWTATRRD